METQYCTHPSPEKKEEDLVISKLDTMTLKEEKKVKKETEKSDNQTYKILVNSLGEDGDEYIEKEISWSPRKKKSNSSSDGSSELLDEEIFATAAGSTFELKKIQKDQKQEKFVFTLYDHSSNGTSVNSKIIGKEKSIILKDGDLIEFVDSDEDGKIWAYKFKIHI